MYRISGIEPSPHRLYRRSLAGIHTWTRQAGRGSGHRSCMDCLHSGFSEPHSADPKILPGKHTDSLWPPPGTKTRSCYHIFLSCSWSKLHLLIFSDKMRSVIKENWLFKQPAATGSRLGFKTSALRNFFGIYWSKCIRRLRTFQFGFVFMMISVGSGGCINIYVETKTNVLKSCWQCLYFLLGNERTLSGSTS